MMKLGFLASRNGSSMRAIIMAARDGSLAADPLIAISNNRDAPALEFAARMGLRTCHLSGTSQGGAEAVDTAIAAALRDARIDLVILSGYMRKVGPVTLAAFAGRILNVHPALLPKFGGPGMYGNHVHAAVLAAGEPVSGATIHLVDGAYDQGSILAQARVPVVPGDTVESLAARVGAIEPALYIKLLQAIASGGARLPLGRHVGGHDD